MTKKEVQELRDKIKSQLIEQKIAAYLAIDDCKSFDLAMQQIVRDNLINSPLFQLQVDDKLKRNLSIKGGYDYFLDGLEQQGFEIIEVDKNKCCHPRKKRKIKCH